MEQFTFRGVYASRATENVSVYGRQKMLAYRENEWNAASFQRK